ncbi:MAG: RNA-binding cell elongation regulator Jag/EloR [Eubacteriales bacterium]|nr:RNA-binding cell elongation regulator Jag/EloR [Eubacteriales bacterium]
MSRFIEASGKTVKDAIQNGLKELGCTNDEVETTVIDMGSPGLFGMFGKPAKVRLTVKEDDHSFDIEMPVFTLDQPAQGRKREKKRESKPAKAEQSAPKAAPAKKAEKIEEPVAEVKDEPVQEESAAEAKPEKSEKRRSRNRKERSKENREPRPEPVTVAAPAEPAEPFVATAEEELSDTAKGARDFLKGLTDRMGVPTDIEVSDSPEQLKMQLSGENMSILIGRRGETLDALQYLTSLNVNRGREEYLRVSLDTENYRAKREEALRKLAVRMANRAKKSGRRVALEPMNPNERRILHSALQNDPEVTTHSEGEEPYRRVIITLK